ncbi:MAG: metallophosphoesterase [Sideroxydans sp.]|nr:metallophosphoesterase [Sideroxydans sp.]
MSDKQLPPGLVLWPDDGVARQRVAVLLSDIHCTDCSVGNQTADETDWETFFRELEMMLVDSIPAAGGSEVLLVLNGDVADLLRSGQWTENNVYPWQNDKPEFKPIVLGIMREIVRRHSGEPGDHPHTSGFFFYLRKMVKALRDKTANVSLIPIAGNHDKTLQGVPEAREIFYRQCLGLEAGDFAPAYRDWVATQMGSDPAEVWPLLPFYFAAPHLRLFATHGHWRDDTNSGTTRLWHAGKGWQPQLWQQEQFRAFHAPCFGDTIASGLLSGFIWNTERAIKREVGADAQRSRILNVLREMDLYRPAVSAIVRLLDEAGKLDRRDPDARQLYQTVIDQFRNSLQSWLDHPETFATAPALTKIQLHAIRFFHRLHWNGFDTFLLKAMMAASDSDSEPAYATLPAFLAAYRPLGFKLHVEGHTHLAMEADLLYRHPRENRNYTYVNLGAWRNRIVQKVGKAGYRRRSTGRALIVRSSAVPDQSGNRFGFTLRDISSWGDDLDRW